VDLQVIRDYYSKTKNITMKKLLFLFFFILSFSLNAQKYSEKQIDSIGTLALKLIDTNPQQTIVMSEKLYSYSKQINYAEGMISSLENIAFSYYTTGQSEKCIEYAAREEEEALAINNYYNACAAVRLKAVSYSLLGFHSEADKQINKALEIVENIEDSDKRHEIKGMIYQAKTSVIYYKHINNYKLQKDSMFFYNKKVLEEFLQIKKNKTIYNSLAVTYLNLADSYTDQGKYEIAENYLFKALAISKKTKDNYAEFKVLFNLARLYSNKKDYEKAIIYYNDVIKKATLYKDPYKVKESYEGLNRIYKNLNNEKKANEALVEYTKLNDSLTNVEKIALKTPLKQIIKEKDQHFNSTKSNLYIVISLCLIFLAATLFLAFRYFKNYNKVKEQKKSNDETILEKNSQLMQLESKVNDAFEEVLELAKNDDPAFLARFKEVYPEFYNNLTSAYPDLTISQLRFCAMLRLNFSTKEIAYYHHTTVRGIQTKKTRLRKQLNLNSEEDLNKWMMNI
jgi:tetratricopeptide (TPR) repeat protein